MSRISKGLGELVGLCLILLVSSSFDTLPLVLAAAVHEASHFITSRICKMKIVSSVTTGAGFSVSYSPGVSSYPAELAVILSGCVASGVCAAFGYIFGYVDFFQVNLRLFLLNLIPARGLDGGEALYVISEWVGTLFAYRVYRIISVICALSLWLFSVRYVLRTEENLTLLVAAVVLAVRAMKEGF